MNNDSVAPQNEMSFQDFKQILSRRKWTVFVCLGIALAGAGAASLALPSAYRTTVRLLAEPQPQNMGYQQLSPEQRVEVEAEAPPVQNQIEVLQSVNILQQAFQNAGVSIPPEALDPDAKSSPVTVKEVGISDAIDTSVDLPTPEASTRVATEIPQVFTQFLTTGTASDFRRTEGHLEDQLKDEQAKLGVAVDALGKFRNDRKEVVAVGEMDPQARTQRLSGVVSQYEAALAELSNARNRYLTLQEERKKLPEFLSTPSTLKNTERIAMEKRQITDLQDRLADARSQFTEQSQEVKSLEQQLGIEKGYLASIPTSDSNGLLEPNPNIPVFDLNIASAKAAFEGAQAEVVSLDKTVADETKQLKDYSVSEPTEQRLLTDVALHTNTVQDLSRQLDQVRVRTQSARNPVSVLSITTPTQVQPAPLKYTIIAVVLGLAMGIIAALAKDKYDDRVFSMDQIYAISGIPPIGQLPASNKTLALTSGSSRNPLLENYRALRFNLDSFSEGGEPIKSVLIASPSGLERRGDLSYNLAVEAATDQRATILVDADLRNPKLHEQFGARLAPGLSDVLRGTVTLEEALQATSNPKLRFLSAGSPEDDPLQLLSSPEMEALHTQLKATADVIILNSSSLLRHADARALAKMLDSVLFVARSGATKLAALRYCVELLRRAKAPLLGIVLSESGGYSDVPYYGRD
jgi:capsular exopolysaccharide synthesis family protein